VLINGKQVAAGDSFEQAKARKSELGVARAKGERIVLPSKVTLCEIAEEWWEQAERGLKLGTARDYRSYLDKIILPKLGRRKLSEIRPADVLSLVREGRNEGVSESTIANRLKPLRAVMEYAVTEKEVLSSSPFDRIGKGKLPSCNATREHREWSTEDVRRLIAVAHKRDERPEARADYGLAIETKVRLGLRLGELLGLQYGDIGDGVLSVRRQWTKYGKLDTPKTKKSLRRVPLPQDLALTIKKRKLAHGCGDSDFVFAEKGHNPPQHSNWRQRGWYPACGSRRVAGVRD
jgi:integrase